jgi:glycosyltransferase involved in cell wall biosynthesis
VGITLHSQGGGDFLSSTMAMQLAYNIPLLSTSIPSFENLKKEEKCLETFKEKNLKDLTKKINDLLYNQSKIRELKINSKRYWNKNNWDEVGRKTKNLYLSLLNKI